MRSMLALMLTSMLKMLIGLMKVILAFLLQRSLVNDDWSDAYIDQIMADLQKLLLETGHDPQALPEESFDIEVVSGKVSCNNS